MCRGFPGFLQDAHIGGHHKEIIKATLKVKIIVMVKDMPDPLHRKKAFLVHQFVGEPVFDNEIAALGNKPFQEREGFNDVVFLVGAIINDEGANVISLNAKRKNVINGFCRGGIGVEKGNAMVIKRLDHAIIGGEDIERHHRGVQMPLQLTQHDRAVAALGADFNDQVRFAGFDEVFVNPGIHGEF